MKRFEFNYSDKFSCINKDCKHNCCIGWDIKIDKKSLDKYNGLKTTDQRFNDNSFNQNFFSMKNGRCPFLDGDNLCHIIKNYGEKSLCTTCKTHPRFKSFFTNVTETGLGLYCEYACKIILSQKEKMKLVLVKDDNKPSAFTKHEKTVLSFRKKVINILQNRKLPIKDRISLLQSLAQIDLNKKSFSDWINAFCDLEKLQINEFSFEKLKIQSSFAPIVSGFDLEYEQLLCYLAFRHLSRAIDSLDLRVRLAFVILSFYIINQIFYYSLDKSLKTLVEACRFYSSEIETNDDNIYSLIDHIEGLVSFI
ncbi:MAG: hypothetical protein E7348_06145 [Clostridiales bacterium]|nr:hypothetical protein [Clostridiales bacterium]